MVFTGKEGAEISPVIKLHNTSRRSYRHSRSSYRDVCVGVPQDMQKAKFMGSSIKVDTNGGTVFWFVVARQDDISLTTNRVITATYNQKYLVHKRH